jgi:hypothetical protein
MLLPMRPRLGAAGTILETVTVEPAGSDILVSRSAAYGGSETRVGQVADLNGRAAKPIDGHPLHGSSLQGPAGPPEV